VRATILVALGAVALLAVGCGARGATGPEAPFHLDVEHDGKLVTTLGGGGPVTFTTTDGIEHQLTLATSEHGSKDDSTIDVATDDPGRTAIVTDRATATGRRLSIQVKPAAGVIAVRITLAAPPSAHFLGTGERTRWVDMRRTVQPLKAWNNCASSAPAPFFASSTGFGAYLESDGIGRIAFPAALDDTSFACDLGEHPCSVGVPVAAVRICVKSSTVAVDVLTGSPTTVVSAYVRHAGLPRAPWLPHFALIKWRDRVSGPQELFDDIDQLRRRGLPVGWVILDNPWEQGTAAGGCFGSLQFDHAVYPDPAGMIKAIHERGVRFMLWVSPQLRKKGCPAPLAPDGWLTGNDEYYVRDLTNPPERADFVSRIRALAALGVDGFKGDRGDEVDLEKVQLHAGSGLALHNAYPRLYQQAVADAMRPYHRQWASLFRTSVPGSAAIVPGFVGDDAAQSWSGLSGSIRSAQTAGIAGEAMWGSDIGGYDGGSLTAELFTRWAQFAALTTIFEVGGVGENATFWQFGDQTVEAFRAAATLHYELAPYLFELVREASRTGIPAVRPLGLTWPNDAGAWAHDLEFTVGDALLAAPVVAAANGPTAESTVYLPAGSWIDLFSGARISGSRTVKRLSGATDFPLYLRAGTALPFNARAPAIWAAPWRPDDLSRSGRQGWLVAPQAGSTARAVTGAARLTATQAKNGSVQIRLTDAAREQQLLVLSKGRVCGVTSGGRSVARVGSRAIVSRSQGWFVDAAAPHTVVIKLHVDTQASVSIAPCAPSK
jgi:alpha-D-xyloside xylohydrolase